MWEAEARHETCEVAIGLYLWHTNSAGCETRERVSDYLRLRRDEAAKIEKTSEQPRQWRGRRCDARATRSGGDGHRKIHNVTQSDDDDERGRNGGDGSQLLVRPSVGRSVASPSLSSHARPHKTHFPLHSFIHQFTMKLGNCAVQWWSQRSQNIQCTSK